MQYSGGGVKNRSASWDSISLRESPAKRSVCKNNAADISKKRYPLLIRMELRFLRQPCCVLLHIILCLRLPEFTILARFIVNQVFMISRLHNFPAVKYGDFVTETAGCQPVADINRRFVP